jgi:predicted Zn finger-like uncharacterized protein
MPITLNCPKCHKPFRVRDESIGGRVRCPSCASVLQVPAALSPGSHYGDLPSAVASAGGPGAPSSAERPMAEDVPGRGAGGPPDHPMLGGPGRRDDAVDFGAVPPGAGPPSIRAKAPPPPPPQQPRPAERAPVTAAVPKAPVARTQRGAAALPTQRVPLGPGSDDVAWTKVHGGLRSVRWALFLCALVFIGAFAHGAWAILDFDAAMDEGPGFLKQPGWPKYKELFVAYTAGPLVPAALLFLFGRLRCGAAPRDSQAAGLARSAAFFTFLAILGAVVYIGLTLFDAGAKLQLPAEITSKAAPIALYATIPSVVLADILTLLFIGQIGWPLGRPHLQRAVAGFFTYVAILPAAVLIADLFYPIPPHIRGLPTKGLNALREGMDNDAVARQVLIWGVVLVMAAALFFLRYAGVAGAGRRAIRKYLAGG